MSAGAQAPGWHWAPTTSAIPLLAGSTVSATVVRGALHVLTPHADGSMVSHARIDVDDQLELLADLPLRSVSGVAARGDAMQVAGARAGDNLPVVCSVAADGELTGTIVLPTPAPVAGWPLLVGGEAPRYVVWATGDLLDATVWLAELNTGRLLSRAPVLSGTGVLSMRAGSADGAVDVLAYGQELRFARLRRDVVEIDRVLDMPGSSAGQLLAGAVLTPAAAHAFRVWQPLSDSVRTLELPEPPERASSRAQHLRLIAAPGRPDLLAWQTHLPDDFSIRADEEDAPRRVHGVSVRGWLAPFDRTRWELGSSSEVPSSSAPPLIEWVGERLALVRPAAGIVQVLLSE